MSKTNEEVCHNYCYDLNGTWSSRSSNLSYEHGRLYSYNSVLAKAVGNTVHIDTRIAHYSSTSSKHASYLRNSTPGYYFEYDFVYDNPLEWYLKQITDLLDRQTRARRADYTSQAIYYLNEAMLYAKINKSDKRTSAYKQLSKFSKDRDNMLEQAKDMIQRANKAKKRAKLKKDKALQSKRQTNLDSFLGTTKEVIFDPDYNGVYLKRVDDILHTTNSIKVLFKDAKLLYKAWTKGKNILGLKLDQYTVVKSSKKSVTIGCTTIGAKELHRIFKEG
jgi:hypothetical protein